MYEKRTIFFFFIISLVNQIATITPENTEKLEGNVKQLKEWDYTNFLKYVEESNRVQVQTDVAKMVTLVENKQYTEIDDQFLNWFNQVFDLMTKIKGNIDGGYVFNESTHIWEKTVTENTTGEPTSSETKESLDQVSIEKIESQVKQLKEINYETLLKFVDPADRERVTTDVDKIIKLVDNKQFTEVDAETVKWFTKIYELLTTINNYVKDGYTYDESTNTWTKNVVEKKPSISEKTTDELETNVKELEEWNFLELLKNLGESEREEAEPVINKMITLVKNKKYAEIDPEFRKTFNRVYKLVRESRPVSNKVLVKRINEFENIDWETILKETEGIDPKLWTRRLKKVIRQVKRHPNRKIQYPWLKELRRIVRVVHKEVKPMRPLQKQRLYQRLRHFNKINWLRGLKRIGGIRHNVWANRIRRVMHHVKFHSRRKMKFPWLSKLRRIVRVIYSETLPVHPKRPLRRVRPFQFVRHRRPSYHRRRRPFHNVRRIRPYGGGC